ncbi:MAG: hypothetical protein ABI561_18300 [Bradyrhizobium sp.]
MATEHPGDQRAAAERTPIKQPSATRPSQQSGPPLFNDGPELLRSSQC